MGKKRRGHGMSGERKLIKKVVSLVFKLTGVAVAVSPVIPPVQKGMTNSFATFGPDVLWAYTGIGGDGQVNQSQLIKGVSSVGGGVFLIWLGRFIAKRV